MSAPGGLRTRLVPALTVLALVALALAVYGWQNEPLPAPALDAARRLGALAASGAWLLICLLSAATVRWQARAERAARAALAGATGDAPPLLIAFASQTGNAERIAWQTARTLADAGVTVRLESFAALDPAALAGCARALFVVSTTGEGDPPDAAAAFARATRTARPALAGLQYGLLALGDRSYADYCGFGRALDAWLRHCGAAAWFDAVEVDDGDEGALRHWQHHLGLIAGRADLPDWSPPTYAPWRLAERRLLNPGSLGGPCFHLALTPPPDVEADWQAGDIAEIGPRNAPDAVARTLSALGFDGGETVRIDGRATTLSAHLARCRLPASGEAAGLGAQALAERLRPLPHREYSIASLPADGALHLLVRQQRDGDGRLGLGSGWLTAQAEVGATIDLRLRRNANFHVPPDARPLLLIGNGTGIAGLRALIKARVAAGRRRNWLLFGERQMAHDLHYGDEIARWHAEGWLEHVDLAFSRDGAHRVYVQDCLRAAATRLRAWVDDGAAVYVCGSLAGMAPAIDAVLTDVLGRTRVERLAAEGRYRRDVY